MVFQSLREAFVEVLVMLMRNLYQNDQTRDSQDGLDRQDPHEYTGPENHLQGRKYDKLAV